MSWNRVARRFTGFAFRNWNGVVALTLFLFALPVGDQAQTVLPGHATDFTSDQYYEPPNGQQVRVRLSGASATPISGGALNITDLKIEMFTVNGKTELIIRAPQCTFSPFDGTAHSAGPLEVLSGDGKMRTTGDGFLWQQTDNSLIISNNVHSVMQLNALKMSLP